MGELKFFLDLTKKFEGNLSSCMPVNIYKIILNPAISMLESDQL